MHNSEPADSARLSRKRTGLAVPVAAFVVLCALLASPVILWWIRPTRLLQMAIVDKTVADTSYREHRGLVWLLNHEKFRQQDGRGYRYEADYYGFFPLPDEKYDVRPVPRPLGRPDLLYIADTYGVYHEEFYGPNRGNRTGKIYGGLETEELAAFQEAMKTGGTVVAEFNAFASPTGSEARQGLSDWLGVAWNGWIARFFPDLTEGGEVPPWAIRNYESQYKKEWQFHGPGFIFTSETDEIVVLEEGPDSLKAGCRMILDSAGTARFKLEGSFRYNYWFDILSLKPGTVPLAHYELNLTDAGRRKLAERAIPVTFPAVTFRQDGPTILYYFAGDFIDVPNTPLFYQARGLARWYQWMSQEGDNRNDRFFWRAYVPMVRSILVEARSNASASPSARQER